MSLKIWSRARRQAAVGCAAAVLVTATAVSGAAYAGDVPPSTGGLVLRTVPSCLADDGQPVQRGATPASVGSARPYVRR
ncbi:hypothetical protein V5D56_14410 [Cellulosimicrobium sp. PMB13]|uniref:hypothetical protein n=1 Tax=Cellulosimicrobium sp. PMB13 TaxID=3120158 RepID=UPI003F4BDEA0